MIESKREMSSGPTRYGLYCIDKRTDAGLPDGLNRISIATQREQLRRLALIA